MKRNKIKPKYLDLLQKTNIDDNIKKINFIDKLEQKIIYFLKTLGLIFLLICGSSIPLIFLAILNINYNNLSTLSKTIYLFICDITILSTFIIIYKKDFFKDLKEYFTKNLTSNIETSFKYWSIGLLIMIISNFIITYLSRGGIAGNEESVRELINKVPLYMLFQLAIYAPITEELIFRKSIKDIINNKYIYILASGLIFGGMHIIGNINTPLDILYIIPYSSLGFAFAALYKKTNNIFSTITIHSFHNTLTLILYLILSLIQWRKYFIQY